MRWETALATERVERKLAAILAADLAGYSRLMGADEERTLARLKAHPVSYCALAGCYAHMGRLDEAREIVARLRAITPVVVPNDLPYYNPGDRELFPSGLRLAA
jgi:pentatricopeptide repeat protein